MTELEACIRLQTAFGVASPVPGRIAASVPSIAEFLTAGRTEWTLSGLLTAAQLDRLEHTDGRAAEQILHQCEYYGYGAVGISERAYPQRLRMIRNAPAVLYIHGTLPQMDREAAIAMVGTREATPTGARVAWQLAHDMARQGAVIVSGGALGIDAAAHSGALRAGGRTVAVLGCGFRSNYLPQNARLREQIARTCALVSEYPPQAPVGPGSFPNRNRIISGLSLGVVVVEAGLRSGALITANDAAAQGRDVFAVPGNPLSGASAGVNQLIRTGAIAAFSADDVLSRYRTEFADVLRERPRDQETEAAQIQTELSADLPPDAAAEPTTLHSTKRPRRAAAAPAEPDEMPAAAEWTPPDCSPKAVQLWRALTAQPQPLDALAVAAGLSARDALAAITELELAQRIESLPGRQYASVSTAKG